MGGMTAAGSALAISAGDPATQNEAGYEALTYTEVGNIEKLGPVGGQYAKVEFQPLKGGKQKFKGSPDWGTLNPTMALDSEDAGQALMFTASEDQIGDYAFKVTKPDGAVRYFQGKVFGMPESIEGADTVIMANATVEINTKPVRVDPE